MGKFKNGRKTLQTLYLCGFRGMSKNGKSPKTGGEIDFWGNFDVFGNIFGKFITVLGKQFIGEIGKDYHEKEKLQRQMCKKDNT